MCLNVVVEGGRLFVNNRQRPPLREDTEAILPVVVGFDEAQVDQIIVHLVTVVGR